MNTEKRAGRMAGIWYLLIAVFYSFSMIYVDSTFYVPGDVAATVNNIQSSGLVFRLGILSCLVGHICFLFLANALYRLFEPVDKHLARLMVLLIVAGVAVAFLNRLNQLAALLLLDSGAALAAFEPAQIQGLSMFFLGLHRNGEMIASLFWALWLLPLSLLIIKGRLIPRAFGVFLLGACASYLVGFVLFFFFPDQAAPSESIRSIIETGAEVSFILWLLIKGVKERKTDTRESVAVG
jgi:hypothetical protein